MVMRRIIKDDTRTLKQSQSDGGGKMRIRKSNGKKEEKIVFISSLLQQCITLTKENADK